MANWARVKAVSWMQWRGKANTAADVVAAEVGALVAARTERVEHGALTEEEVRVRRVVLVLAQGRHLRRVLAIALAHLHGQGLDQNHHTVHAAAASRLTASMATARVIGRTVVVFLRIEWLRD